MKFDFSYSKLRKQPFFGENFNIKGGLALLPTPMLVRYGSPTVSLIYACVSSKLPCCRHLRYAFLLPPHIYLHVLLGICAFFVSAMDVC